MLFHRSHDAVPAAPSIDGLVDHVVGIEQQLIELTAAPPGATTERREQEFVALIDELADTADEIARRDRRPVA